MGRTDRRKTERREKCELGREPEYLMAVLSAARVPERKNERTCCAKLRRTRGTLVVGGGGQEREEEVGSSAKEWALGCVISRGIMQL